MRNRTVGINVRVTVTEKKKVTMLARKCGLSLSEYLRQRALGYEPLPDLDWRAAGLSRDQAAASPGIWSGGMKPRQSSLVPTGLG